MEISVDTIISKRALGTAFLATAITALIACSSTPTSAPWKQADDSPWSSKREAANEKTYENAASEVTTSDPVLIADNEPEVAELQSAPPAVIEPEPVVETVVVAAPAENLSAEQQVLAMDSSAYAVQVYASTTEESMERFKVNKDMQGLMVVRTNRDDKTVYVLIDVHDDLAEAKQAAVYLEKKSGTKPWIRSIAGLQKIVAVE